ncbi:MAG: hypothetical protein IKV94_02610 [Clostridia bacterium]|nr:hypothetical protein [Clostridia bacterium]MBR6517092.1 hypothetical protein [Bacilli bacterium]
MATIYGTASGYWTFKVEVDELNPSIENNNSQVRLRGYIGREAGHGGYGYDGRYNYKVKIDNNALYTREEYNKYQSQSAIGSGQWASQPIFDVIFTIPHNSDGTKTINVVAEMNSSYISPSNANASGNVILTPLHKPPVISISSITERNSALTEINVPNNTIVQYLSTKRFVMATPTLYDNATIVSYTVYHNGIELGTSGTGTIDANFSLANELTTIIINNIEYVPIDIVAVDSLNGITTLTVNYQVIKYTRPTIQKSLTNIKRDMPLTASEALLNFIGTIYKGNDVVGNANTQQVQYKIWNTTEPSYSNVNSSQSEGNVTVSNYEISNISYLNSWNYKIKIRDTFINSDTNVYVKEDRIPTGKAVWTEYPDRVDFINITIDDEEIASHETISDWEVIKYYNGTAICCLNYNYTIPNSWTSWGSMYTSAGIQIPDYPITFIEIPTTVYSWQRITGSYNGWLIAQEGANSSITNCGNLQFVRPTNPNASFQIGIRIIAIGKWK